MERPHEYMYMDEAGFNLTKRRRRGRNVIGHRAIVGVPGQRGGNVTLCAAISNHGVVHHHANLGPYNTHQLLNFLNHMRDALLGQQDEHPIYVVVWDNVSFHRALQVREWFNMNQGFINLWLPPYSPFLNPIEEFFSSWRWKVYECQPYTRVNLLQAMGLACGDIGVEACQAWIRHARVFFPPLPGQTKCGL